MPAKTAIFIVGPTAVGKTQTALYLARYFDTAIISADSRQCYKELNIGVAKPSVNELQEVKHYFINSHSITEDLTAAVFERYALDALSAIFSTNDIAIVAGGTGLYIRALSKGFDAIPAVPAKIREDVQKLFDEQGFDGLSGALQKEDPLFVKTGEMKNPQRMKRALEVVRASGLSIRSFQKSTTTHRDFNMIFVGIELPRKLLYDHINKRVDNMINEGLLEEVKSLVPWRNLNALQTVGYKELFAYLDGNLQLADSVSAIKQNTRHYAKRQLTWFKADPLVEWFAPGDEEKIIQYIREKTILQS